MFKRKLFKRALPVILSVAMIFQSMPATALAAENEMTEVVETTVEDSGSESDAGDEAKEPANEEPEAPAAEQPEASTPAEETKQEEADTPATTTVPEEVSASTEEPKQEETSAPAESTTQEETSAPVETTAPETTTAEEEATDEELQQAEADEVAAAKIIVDEQKLKRSLDELNGLRYEDGVVSGSYDPDKKIFDKFVNDKLKGSTEIISVKVGNEENANLKDNLTFKWVKEDKDLPAGDTPKDTGSYRLVISLAAIDGLCSEATADIAFEIKQAELELNLDAVSRPEIDTTIADFEKDFQENCVLVNPNEQDEEGNAVELNKDTYVNSIAITVKDAVSGTAITDKAVKFEKGKDYSYTVSVELKDANYTVKDIGVQDIELQGEIETKMEVTLSKNIEYTYGDEVKMPAAGTDYTVKVSYDKGTNEETGENESVDIMVPADSITAKWLNADGNEIEAPTDAGTYYVLLTYTDGTGRYKECDNAERDEQDNIRSTDFMVVINPVSIYVKPKLDKTEYTDGKTAADILYDVKYDLFTTKDNTALGDKEFDQKTGWGVSYNQDGMTQYYEPVFTLEVATLQLDDDGNPMKDEAGKLVYGEYEAVDDSNARLVSSEKFKYRVVFSGQKAVYDYQDNDDIYDRLSMVDVNHGTNGASVNYKVDVSDDTLDKNFVDITITKTNAVIDVSKYTEARKKIFDYEPFYADRASYKNATVDGDDKNLSYRWYEAYEGEKPGEYEQGEDELYDFQYTYENGQIRNAVSPIAAGTYMLVISYRDPAHEKAAEDVQLIYEIEPQKIAAEVATGTEGNKVTAYSGTSIGEFTGELADTLAKAVKKIENNDDQSNKLVEDDILSLWEYGSEYKLIPVIERQDNIDASVWKPVGINETFLEGGHYRLAFGVDINDEFFVGDSNLGEFFNNNYQSSYTDETEDGTEVTKYYLSNYVDITVEKMGTTPLELKVDTLGTMTKVYDGTPFAVPAEAIKIYNKNTGELVTDISLQYTWQEDNKEVDAINGGKYTLYASFSGNEVYAPLEKTMIGETNGFEITKRAINVAPFLYSKIEAGIDSSTEPENIVQNAKLYDEYDDEDKFVYALDITGNILNTETISEEWAFSPTWQDEYGYRRVGYKAIQSYDFKVMQADGTAVPDSVLKAEQNYYIVTDIELSEPYNRNYEVTNNKAEFTPVRVSASVFKYPTSPIFDNLTRIPATSLKDFMGNDETDSKVITHTIVPREGIPFVLAKKSGIKDSNNKDVGGNLFVFKIQAPKEFFRYGNTNGTTTNSFAPVFENAIKDNGGYVITTEKQTKEKGFIIAAFKTEGKDEKPSFTVRWSDGYVEKFTVDFTKAVLEDDFTKAVKPKSLSFNSPVTKMVIGGKQQLDVKITKAKLDDVICLKYQTLTENSTVLSVSETGAVVALAVGSETVQAIPCYLDEDGEKQPIEGAKVATVKISVVAVTAPKIKAVTALDTTATVTYSEMTDGYRREIYVLKNPKAKEKDFTDAIALLRNGDWKAAGFAIAPVYISNEYDPDIKLSKVSLRDLTPNKQYAVYVRNVSGIRKLADGSSVVDSAKGAVKSFKTTASQVQNMQIRFDQKYWFKTVYDDFYDYEKGIGAYVVNVSEKKIPSLTVGMFLENAENTNASQRDIIEYPLPLDKAKLACYAQPKLSYFAVNDMYDYTYEPENWYTLKIKDKYYQPSNIAKVDNKGNVTLTGKGWVDLVVFDSVTGKIGGGRLYITAQATKMTVAKSAKIRVGEALDLANCVTYYAEKQKLTSYWSDLRITNMTGDIDAFTIAYDEDNPDYPSYIIAKEPKKSITVEITDTSMEKDNVGEITISSKDIEAVKNLKVTEVVDKYATVSFTYPASAFEYVDKPDTAVSANQLYFRIQILDAAKNVVSDKYYHSYLNNESKDGKVFDKVQYDAKKKLYTFTKYIGIGKDRSLNRKSAYTVSVTATYLENEVTSKPASKGFKTTDIPAAYQSEYGGEFPPYSTEADSEYKTTDGGFGITIGRDSNGNDVILSSYPALTSNNTYTLVAQPENREAKNRLSDTLTWKSTNTKVATVKANAGSYTATLKALKKGITKIELTSKLTKKIVARWTVFVNAAGEASTYYFGDWEPDEDNTLVGGVENGDIELLTLDNPVKARLEVGEGKLAKFVAPEYGFYRFWSNGSILVYYIDDEGKLHRDSAFGNGYGSTLCKGEVRYIKVVRTGLNQPANITITANGTIYEVWSGVGEYTLKKSGKIAFTAPEDNYYTVRDSKGADAYEIGAMKAGETKVIPDNNDLPAGKYTVAKRETAGNTFDEKGLTKQSIDAKTTKWYVFAPTYDMEFTLGMTDKRLTMSVYEDITSGSAIENLNSVKSAKISLKSGEKCYIAVTNGSLDAIETDITVKAEAESGTVNGTTSVELKAADEGKYVLYRIPADGYYRFKVSATQIDADKKEVSADVSAYYAKNTNGYTDPIDSVSEKEFKKDEIVYVYVESSDATEKNAVTVKIDVTEIKVENIAAGVQTKTLGSDYSYYKFTATQNGEYTFKAAVTPRTGEGAVTPSAYLYSCIGKTFNINDFEDKDTYVLKNGDTVYLRVNTDDRDNKTDEVKISISRLEAESFTTKWSKELAAGETKWIQFKALQDARYSFKQETKQAEEGKGTVSITRYTTLSNTGNDISVPSGAFHEYYKAGEYFYLKLQATGGKVTYTIEAKQITPGNLPVEDAEIEANEEAWYAFTAPATARYKVELTGNDAAQCSMDRYDSLKGSSTSIGNISEITLEAGKTVYYVVSNTTEAKKTVSLSITPLSVEALSTTAGKPADLKVNGIDSVWYSFTADKAGRYSFNAEAKAAEGANASAGIEYYKDVEGKNKITDISSNPEKAVFVKAKDTIYIKVSVSGADATVTTTVKAITTIPLPADGKTETDIAKDSYVWYELKGEGIYTIATSDLTADGSLTMWGVKNSENSFTQNPGDVTLGKSDVYTIVIKANTDKLGYKLTATKREVMDLTLATPVSGELKTGEDLYVSFKAPEQGRYAVSLKGLADDVASTMSVTGGESQIKPSNNRYCSFVSNINDVVTFKINVTSEASVKFNVEAELVNPEDITANGAATVKVAETPAGYVKWYSYTAGETGKYVVKVSDSTTTVCNANKLTGSFNSNGALNEVILTKGETYYYALYYTTKPEKDVTFSITKAAANELNTEYIVDVSKLIANENTYLSFTAPADGRYVFTCDNPSVSAYTYVDIDSVGSNNSLNFGTDKPMKAGTELVFAVSASTVPEKNFKISVHSVEFKTLEESTAEASKPVTEELASDEVLWLSFRANETAKYAFDMTNVEHVEVYKSMLNEDEDDTVYSTKTYGVDNGQTIYLKLIPDSSATAEASGKIKVSISVSVDTKMTKLSADENPLTEIATGESWAYFTADAAGFYTFETKGDCIVQAYRSMNASGLINDKFALGKGESVYFKIENNTGDVATETITINKVTEVKDLVIGGSDNVLTDDSKYAYYVLTAPEKGTYYITANKGSIYTGDTLNSFSYSGSSVSLSLDKDQVKYIGVNTSALDCVVTCTKASEEILTLEKPVRQTMQKTDAILVKWTAENDGYYRIQSTENDSSPKQLFLGYVRSGEEKKVLVTVQNDNTKVEVSVEPVRVKEINGQVSSESITLKGGESLLIEWTAEESGSYKFDIWSAEYIECLYYPNGLNNNPISDNSWIEDVTKGSKLYVFIQALGKNAKVTFSVEKEVRSLTVGSVTQVTLTPNESETFTFKAQETKDYLFYSNANLQIGDGSARSVAVNYGNGYIKKSFVKDETATVTVTNSSDSVRTMDVYAYTLSEEFCNADINQEIKLSEGEEKWFNITISEAGLYEFNSSHNDIYMELYKNNIAGERLEKSNDSIKLWLEPGMVLLRTYAYNHRSVDDYLTVAVAEVQTVNEMSSIGNTVYRNVLNAQQMEIDYTYSSTNDNETKAKISFNSSYQALNWKLFLGDETEPVETWESVSSVEYEVSKNEFDSIRLIVWADKYEGFYANISSSAKPVEYEYTETNIVGTLDNLKIPQNGSVTVEYQPVDEAGRYEFAGNYDAANVTVYMNDKIPSADAEETSGFKYTLDLNVNDKIKVVLTNNNISDRTVSLESKRVVVDVTETATLAKDTQPLTISADSYTTKTVTYTIETAGLYTFTLETTDSSNNKFELTAGENAMFSKWNTATSETKLEANSTITLKLWNIHNGSAEATLKVTYKEETPTEPPTEQGNTEQA